MFFFLNLFSGTLFEGNKILSKHLFGQQSLTKYITALSAEGILTGLITSFLIMIRQIELRSFLARKLASFCLNNHPGQIPGFSNTTPQKLHAVFLQERTV
jgi:hypothetical protein